jgi:hypothetical protein
MRTVNLNILGPYQCKQLRRQNSRTIRR